MSIAPARIVSPSIDDAGSAPKLTLLGALTVAGDLLVISLLLLLFSLGIVTAAPAAAGALAARRDVNLRGPSGPAATIWRGVKENFRSLWIIGPATVLLAISGWVALAFWLTVPAPLSVVMISVVTLIVAVGTLVVLAIPAAREKDDTLRSTLRRAIGAVAMRPFPSVLALLAFAACVVLTYRFPPVGIALLGAACVEIAYRTWVRRAQPKT